MLISHTSSRVGRFSPVAGIQWVETLNPSACRDMSIGFSPVAGIQWVETTFSIYPYFQQIVSVPLPGFSGLRLNVDRQHCDRMPCFSPVAGIQWVETPGILEAIADAKKFQSRCRDSVG